MERAHRLAMEGTPKQAKYAARVLAYSKEADDRCLKLVEVSHPLQIMADEQEIVSELSITNEQLVAHLSALSELALSCPGAFGDHSDRIIDFVTKKVLHAKCPDTEVSIL